MYFCLDESSADNEHGEDDTSIGDTVFSKSWTLSVLVRAVQTVAGDTLSSGESLKRVEEEEEEEEGGGRGREVDRGEGRGEREERREEEDEDSLDKELEEDLCHLWDASMNGVRIPSSLSLNHSCTYVGIADIF